MKNQQTVVLDAMGVIFRAQDDVDELLIPFVSSRGSSIDEGDLSVLYEKASLGILNVDEFWRELGLDPSVEDEYLAQHELNDGVLEFLAFSQNHGMKVWCLSNDVSRWSAKLRKRFALQDKFAGFVISGDIGFRKPSDQAYRCLIDRVGAVPDLFVDDRPNNVSAAQSAGIPSVYFGPSTDLEDGVKDFRQLIHKLSSFSA